MSFDDTALSALAIDGIELSPGFDPEVADYNAEADADAGRVTVSAETVHLEATAVIAPDDADGNLSNGHQVALGNDGASITVSVTAQDGSAVRFYSITVGRDGVQPARSGRLAGITVGGEDIDFAPGRHRFAATADAGSTTMEFEAAGESVVKGFVLSAGGSEFVPVGYDGVVEMTPGRDTLVAVRASAPGYQRQNLYTVRLRAPEVGSDQQGSQSRTPPPPPPSGAIAKSTLTDGVPADSSARSVAQPATPRAAPSDAEPQLSALSVSPGVLTPAFGPGVNEYSVRVTHEVGQITLSATAPADRQVVFSAPDADSATAGIQVALNSPFSNGRSSQTAFVVAVSDETRTQSYTVTVTRAAPSVPERSGFDLAADAATTGRLGVDDYVTGRINNGDDVDWYAVELKANRGYTFNMIGGYRWGELTNAAITGLYTADGPVAGRPTRPTRLNCRMDQLYWWYGDYVLCGANTNHWSADSGFWNQRGSMVYYKPLTSGTYYIGVTTLRYWNSGTYNLILRDLDAEFVDLNYPGGIGGRGQLEVGMPAAGFIDYPKVRFGSMGADADYFEVDLVAGRRYRITGTDGKDATGHSTNIKLPRPMGTGTTTTLEFLQIQRVFLVTDNNGSDILTEIPPSWWTDDPSYYTPAPGTSTEGWYDRRWPSNPRTLTAPRTGTYRIRVAPCSCSLQSCDGRSWGGYQVTIDDITDE